MKLTMSTYPPKPPHVNISLDFVPRLMPYKNKTDPLNYFTVTVTERITLQ